MRRVQGADRQAEPRLDHRRAGGHRGGAGARGHEGVHRAGLESRRARGDDPARARRRSRAAADTTLVRASSLYDTEPVGEVDQPNFLNAVAQIDTELTARQLLWNLQLIEKRLGRVRTQRWGPRTIDLDLLLLRRPGGRGARPQIAAPRADAPLVRAGAAGRARSAAGASGDAARPCSAILTRLDTRPPVKRGSRLWN